MENIRNFVIIAHIDAGKSTLADRLLEFTQTINPRKMRPQYLDQLELERERGITIKMAPVRMFYKNYILNLIDTPGHSDFSYEVSRALAAVDGAILLVDATAGIQAQTLSNFYAAKKAGLKIIGAINKIDLFNHDKSFLKEIIKETAMLIGSSEDEIHLISAKTGQGIENLLNDVILKVPPPKILNNNFSRALIFDSIYNENKGVIAYVKVFDGNFKNGEKVSLFSNNYEFKIKEVGYFVPELKSTENLKAGEIGYIATGIKEPSLIYIGDTIMDKKAPPLEGYKNPMPVVFVSFYPDKGSKFEELKKAFDKLHLSDAALNIEPENNEVLGRGLKVGFLGKLHFEIISTRLLREFKVNFLTTFPSVLWKIKKGSSEFYCYDANQFPDKFDKVFGQFINLEILAPQAYLNNILKLQPIFDFQILETENLGNQIILKCKMPLLELIYDFDDKLKSVSEGFASFSYEINGEEEMSVSKMEVLINGEIIKALTRIVPQKDLEKEARQMALRLKNILPRKQFSQAIQIKANNKIIAREDISALKKDVTGYLYGGDRTRKMKLWQKQKEGKKKLKSLGKIDISPDVFKEILKK